MLQRLQVTPEGQNEGWFSSVFNSLWLSTSAETITSVSVEEDVPGNNSASFALSRSGFFILLSLIFKVSTLCPCHVSPRPPWLRCVFGIGEPRRASRLGGRPMWNTCVLWFSGVWIRQKVKDGGWNFTSDIKHLRELLLHSQISKTKVYRLKDIIFLLDLLVSEEKATMCFRHWGITISVMLLSRCVSHTSEYFCIKLNISPLLHVTVTLESLRYGLQ